MTEINHSSRNEGSFLNISLWLGGGLMLAGGGLTIWLLSQLPFAAPFMQTLNRLFAADSVQVMWYITRAAGLTSYMLLWLSVALGLGVSSKIFDVLLHRAFTFDFHEFLSLVALGFIGLHMGALLFDHYLPYSLAQILIPFLSPYRPFWVGVGVIGMYLTVLVTVTFYLRSRIGMKTFRAIHGFSLLAYLGVTLHGLLGGTDASLPSVLWMYAGTFLVVVFLTAYWAYVTIQKKGQKEAPAGARREMSR